jgi:hypothetical protein
MRIKTRIILLGSLLVCCFSLMASCGNHHDDSTLAITAQPADENVVVGANATFSVTARNATGYQWQSSNDNGATFTALAGATAASYTTPATTLTDNGQRFRVVITGESNTVTSSAATLTVSTAPVAPAISVQVTNQTVVSGNGASFSVTATGTSLNYQWQCSTDGGTSYSDISDAINATLTLTNVTLGENGYRYRVVVSNAIGNVTSDAAILTVNAASAAPQFTTPPANASVVAPNTATFSVVATGNPVPTLQWQTSTDGGTAWNSINGATSTSYTTGSTSVADSGQKFRAVATNSVSSVNSNAATLTVTAAPAAPQFTTQPANASVTASNAATFSVAVTGNPTPTLQWQISTDSGTTWSNINGATSTSYTTGATTGANSGQKFRAVATNSVSSVNSNAATLTVTAVAAWGPSPNLRFADVGNTSQNATYVDFAMNATGDAMAVWVQNDGTTDNLWANRYTVSGGWGTPQLIETSTSAVSSSINPNEGPRVAINANGSAVAVWEQNDGAGNIGIWANCYTVANGWGTAQVIDTTVVITNRPSDGPRVGIDGNGNAIAVWHKHDGALRNVWANQMSSNGSWGTPFILENNDTDRAIYPSIAMNNAGKAVVAWGWSDASQINYGLVAARYYDGSSWGSVQNITTGTETAGSPQMIEVGIDTNGNAIAVWKQMEGGILKIKSNRYAGGWGLEENISDVTTHAVDVDVAVNASGSAVAVWLQYDSSFNPNVYANRYVPGSGWGTAAPVETFTDQAAISPRCAIDSTGNAFALMGRIMSASPGRLRANRAPVGSAWGADVGIDGVSYSGAPMSWRIAVDDNGRAMALWVQEGPNGSITRVYFNRYE